jgi:hypothetical protein
MTDSKRRAAMLNSKNRRVSNGIRDSAIRLFRRRHLKITGTDSKRDTKASCTRVRPPHTDGRESLKRHSLKAEASYFSGNRNGMNRG